MTKHAWLVALFACIWLSGGCSEVESCRETITPGCINTAPRPDGSCLYDLVLRGNKCVKPGSAEDLCGLCAKGALCAPERNTCIDFCAVPAALQGSIMPPDAISCEAFKETLPDGGVAATTSDGGVNNPMLGFDEVCRRRCRLRCQRFAQFCPGYQCPAGSCDGPEVQAKCLDNCPKTPQGGNDLACLTRTCEDAQLAQCDSSLMCPNGITPVCSSITCTNDCSFQYLSQGVVGDGICDDGDVLSSMSPDCPWGTDCADCGPRSGAKPAPAPLGDLCQWAENCAGATTKPSTATAWCVNLKTTKASRCMPDCSRGQPCAAGFECRVITYQDPNTGVTMPVVEGTFTSSACIPLACE